MIRIFSIGCFLALTACGFHLRGNLNFPSDFQHVYLQVPPEGRDLKIKLKDRLRSFRIRPHHTQEASCYQLVIDELKFNRQIANISSSTTPRQFQLAYSVFYHFTNPQGETLIPRGFALANRLVSMNSERLLGSNYEQDFFKSEMEDELVGKILNNLPPAIMARR
jgi:LPS-assembly lipoprotein